MGGENATLTAEESAARLQKILSHLNLQDTGKFISYDGSEISW
jgi:hypothetical protein